MSGKGHTCSILVRSVPCPATMEISMETDLPYDLGIPRLGIYPCELKSEYEKVTYIPIFTAAQSMIAKKWKQSRYLWKWNWLCKTKTTWYTYFLEYHTVTVTMNLSDLYQSAICKYILLWPLKYTSPKRINNMLSLMRNTHTKYKKQ